MLPRIGCLNVCIHRMQVSNFKTRGVRFEIMSDVADIFFILVFRTDLSSEHWAGDLRRRWRQFVETSSNFLFPTVLPFLGSAGCWLMRNTGVIPEFLRSFVDEFVDCDGIVNNIMNYFSPVKQITA